MKGGKVENTFKAQVTGAVDKLLGFGEDGEILNGRKVMSLGFQGSGNERVRRKKSRGVITDDGGLGC